MTSQHPFVVICDMASGRIVCGGYSDPPYDPATQAVLHLDGPIDIEAMRYDAITKALRPATPEEIEAARPAPPLSLEAEWMLGHRLGRSPSPADLATARAEIAAIERTRRATEPGGRGQAAPTRPRG